MRETVYEWVVETLADDGSGDIVDCSYWPERERANAEAQFAAIAGPKDFGLCRRVWDDDEGDVDRQYLYRSADGQWPGRVMEGGAALPVRFSLSPAA